MSGGEDSRSVEQTCSAGAHASSFGKTGRICLVSCAAGASGEIVGGAAGWQSSQLEMTISAGLLTGGLAKAAVKAAIPRALSISEARMETVISAEFRRVWLAKG